MSLVKKLIVADYLSRNPLNVNCDEELKAETQAFVNFIANSFPVKDKYMEKIKHFQENDRVCKLIKGFISEGWPDKAKLPAELYEYYQYRFDFSNNNGLLLKGSRIYIPPPLRKEVMDFIHSGHFGITKCRERAKMSVWWPKLSTQLCELIRNCHSCVEERTNHRETFYHEPLPDRPWKKLGADLFKCNNFWYLIVTDYYSKFFEIFKLNSMSEEVIILKFKELFSRYGISDIVRTDNGPQFQFKFKKFSESYNFVHETSSPYFPTVEWAN